MSNEKEAKAKTTKAVCSQAGLIGNTTYNVGDDVEIPEDRMRVLEERGVINDQAAIAVAKTAKPKPAKKAAKAKSTN